MTGFDPHRIKVGDHVFHRGSKKNGLVLLVRPMPDRSAEILVDSEGFIDPEPRREVWWPSYYTEVGEWDWSRGGQVFVTPLDKCGVCGHALSMHNSLGYCRSRTSADGSGECVCDGSRPNS